MIGQLELIEKGPIKGDVVYTPDKVAREIIAWLNPSGICLDPCLGDGAFFKHLPEGSDWCELRKGRNFFDYERQIDWIIGNPPYSIFEDWLRHSFELADNVAYILPINKVFQRQVIMKMINEWGGIKEMKVYGSGAQVGFPFGFSVGTFHFLRGWKGECEIELAAAGIV